MVPVDSTLKTPSNTIALPHAFLKSCVEVLFGGRIYLQLSFYFLAPMAKLCYHFSFIDEESESTSMLGMKRAQSCKIPEHGLERVDWQSQMQV